MSFLCPHNLHLPVSTMWSCGIQFPSEMALINYWYTQLLNTGDMISFSYLIKIWSDKWAQQMCIRCSSSSTSVSLQLAALIQNPNSGSQKKLLSHSGSNLREIVVIHVNWYSYKYALNVYFFSFVFLNLYGKPKQSVKQRISQWARERVTLSAPPLACLRPPPSEGPRWYEAAVTRAKSCLSARLTAARSHGPFIRQQWQHQQPGSHHGNPPGSSHSMSSINDSNELLNTWQEFNDYLHNGVLQQRNRKSADVCEVLTQIRIIFCDIQTKTAESSKSGPNQPLQIWIPICGLWTNHYSLSLRFSWRLQIDCKLEKIVMHPDTPTFIYFSCDTRFCQNIICISPQHDVSHE